MREQIPDNGDARRAGGNHVRRCLERNTSDSDNGPIWSNSRCLAHSREPDRLVPRRFRRCAKDGPDGDVRDRLLYSRFDLCRSVCGITDDRAGSEQAACSGRREVLLPHVRARCACQERDVHAIVHDHARAVRIGRIDQTFGMFEKCGRREMLRA